MTHIAHQNDAFYIQKKNARNADCAQQLNNQSVTQTLKYCDICDQTPAMPKILDSRIGCSVNNLDKRQSRSTKFAPPFSRICRPSVRRTGQRRGGTAFPPATDRL